MRKILIINRLGIGDVVLTTPLAQLIKEHMPNVQVGFLVAGKAIDLLKNHLYIDDIFAYKNRHEKKNIIDSIKAKQYTDAIIVDGRLSSTIMAWKSGCRPLNKGWCFSIGRKHFFGRKAILPKAIDDFASYAKSLLHIDFDNTALLPKIGRCDAGREETIAIWVEDMKKITAQIVLIAARTAADIKNWNTNELGRLNVYLNQKGIKPVYIGAPDDCGYIDSIAGEKINAAGKFALRDIPEIGKYANWALSMCTGPLHILGTVKNLPIIAIYGPSDPVRWAPRSAMVVQSKLPCVPCLDWAHCDKPIGSRCMDEIKFERVRNVLVKYELL